jgi:hypothetical protein
MEGHQKVSPHPSESSSQKKIVDFHSFGHTRHQVYQRNQNMKISLFALASIALTADALLTNPLGQKKTGAEAPTDVGKQ